jgi:hypothetical protein
MPNGSGWKDRHARLQNAMDHRAWAASNLAALLLAGPWTRRAIAAAIDSVLGAINKMARADLIDGLMALAADRYPPAPARAAGAHYTRYADDLAFSGDDDFAKSVYRFKKAVGTIVGEEGFALNPAKSRIMKRGVRQRITGILVNAHCNTGRAEFETLEAILYNCARGAPAAQNRAGVPDFRRHLEGRIAWVAQVNPRRGMKLWGLFDRIDWTADGA